MSRAFLNLCYIDVSIELIIMNREGVLIEGILRLEELLSGDVGGDGNTILIAA